MCSVATLSTVSNESYLKSDPAYATQWMALKDYRDNEAVRPREYIGTGILTEGICNCRQLVRGTVAADVSGNTSKGIHSEQLSTTCTATGVWEFFTAHLL